MQLKKGITHSFPVCIGKHFCLISNLVSIQTKSIRHFQVISIKCRKYTVRCGYAYMSNKRNVIRVEKSVNSRETNSCTVTSQQVRSFPVSFD